MTAILETGTPAPEITLEKPPRRIRLARPRPEVVAVVVVLVVQAWNITGYPAASDDEGTYLAQAWAVQHGHGLAPYTYWYDHPPLGWVQIALLSWLPGEFASSAHLFTASMRVVMLPVTAVSCLLLATLARRIGLSRWTAALAVLLLGLSPLAVSLQRELFLDNFAVLWMLAAFVLVASPRQDLWHHAGAGLAAAAAVLSKETMALALPALALLFWQHSHRSTRKFTGAGALTSFALLAALYPLYAVLKNELFPGTGHVSLLGGLLFQMQRQGSRSMLFAGSASRQVLDSWLYYDHVLIIGGTVAALALLVPRRTRAIALAAVLLVLVALRPGYLPAMYVIQVLPFFALCLAAACEAVCGLLLRGVPRIGLRPLRWTALALVAVLAAGWTVPRWYAGDRTAVTVDANRSYDQAAVWIRDHVPDPAHARVAVDDALWLDLVRDGFQPGTGAIWFYKLDLDPAVSRTLPHGWRSLDYIVSTPTLRQPAATALPTVAGALAHSTVLATFGTGADRIEIRRIDKSATAAKGP